MEDSTLLFYNSRGYIPGPDESEEEFLLRIQKNSNKSSALDSREWTALHLKEIFDFIPASIDVFYSNKNLAPWEGAACWMDEGFVSLQLREGFKKGKFLWYSKEEVLAHEAVHAARAAFQEEENEEFFAYLTSTKKWRRVLGPILKRPFEAWVWLIFCFLGMFWSPFLWIATFLVGFAFYRLIRQHFRLRKAGNFLMKKIQDAKKVRALLLRLTDKEIRTLARSQWIEKDSSLRWRLIELAYLNY